MLDITRQIEANINVAEKTEDTWCFSVNVIYKNSHTTSYVT